MATDVDVQLTLPYFADELPAPLPTQGQIENDSELLAAVTSRKVVRVGEHYVVKYGANTEEVEAATMIYLRNTTSINIPKVYAVYRSGVDNVLFIVMEFVPGDNLDMLWPNLSAEYKQRVCLELKLQLNQLRSLPSLGYFGGVGRRPMPDGMFRIHERETPHINGPFSSEDELNTAIVQKTLLADEIWGGRGPQRAQFYQRMLPKALRNHNPVFTHGDLQRKNVIVRSIPDKTDGQKPPQSDKLHVTLIDWEFSGWYPSYWEFCAASWAFIRFNDDWPEYAETIVDPWPIEYAWLQLLRESLWS